MSTRTASSFFPKFFINDHLYSPVVIVDNSGNVKERYEYDAYGQPTIQDANHESRTTSHYQNSYLFTGRRVDILDSGSLKIQYNRNRYYDYYTGRWLTHDPLGYLDGINLYEYCGSNPLNRLDFSGFEWIDLPYKEFTTTVIKSGPCIIIGTGVSVTWTKKVNTRRREILRKEWCSLLWGLYCCCKVTEKILYINKEKYSGISSSVRTVRCFPWFWKKCCKYSGVTVTSRKGYVYKTKIKRYCSPFIPKKLCK